MSLIDVSKLTFAYDGGREDIFTDVSFQMDTDWKLGFCGRNGRGKTTFLKLLMGKYEYAGTISANVNFDYFPLDVADSHKNTIDILEGIAPDALLWKVQKELSKLAVDENVLRRPFATLSNGERTKVLLAGLFLRENNFLLIDEPTNHLDMAARQIVARYLKGKAGFILVSHDRNFLDECVDHILLINKTSIEITRGNFSVWAEQKERRDSFEMAQNQRLESEIGRLRESAAQRARWADKTEKGKFALNSGLKPDRGFVGHKAAKMMKKSKTIEKRLDNSIDQKSRLLKNIETAQKLELKPQAYRAKRLLELSDVAIVYDGREVLRGLNLTLESGDRVALQGGNGSGKSSILKLICGENVPRTGQVNIGSQLVISYVPQDASFLTGSLTDYAEERQVDKTLFMSMLNKLDFSRAQFDKDMGDYSAGQKKKVLIARSLCERAHVYVWDEPLNYVDVLSRMQIEELILAYKPTMIFVEHDKAFCDKVATTTLPMAYTRLPTPPA
ncbi:MAG: ABC-F type ribosomal protection protein [Treponema sp.]|nr:ABC-F type ribosomal protection protein [Treponema sp.]